MPNRLAGETSPYLLQHQNNPVDWYPWGEEAFAKAKAENKPVFLSIGYSSCHWCHVMEHESFEDEAIAGLLNSSFVAVKVDREERPDVDDAYMAAVQLTSGRGGWPMSVFLTPDKAPFFAGTYFPKEDRGQHPGFSSVLVQIANAWKTRQGDLQKAALQISEAIGKTLAQRPPATFTKFDQAFLDNALRALMSDFDRENGGFGPAPKFPPHSGIRFLLSYATNSMAAAEMREAALAGAMITLQRMAMGGIHDHIGGGFHRYSTDGEWLLPHFEKMLYDNALMLANLAQASVIAEEFDPALAVQLTNAAGGIVEWLVTEMTAPEGWFYSALDADSEGEEGKYYVWTEEEVRKIVGPRADEFLKAFNFSPEGNFRDEATRELTGTNIPHLSVESQGDFSEELLALSDARRDRIRPGLDDKGLVGWNGLTISALSDLGLLPLATRAAEAILAAEKQHGRLPRGVAKGRPFGDAYLEDYGFFSLALLRLAEVLDAFNRAGEPVEVPQDGRYFQLEGVRLAHEMISKFYDEQGGGFFATADAHEDLFGRTKPIFDQPVPSGNSAGLTLLIALGDEKRATQTLQSMIGWMERAPTATEALLEAAMPMLLMSPVEAPAAAVPAAVVADVTVSMPSREIVAGPDGFGVFEVRIAVPEGLHLNSNNPPARWLAPTKVEIQPLKAEVSYPEAVNDRFEGQVVISFRVPLPKGESGAEFEVKVSYQACTESECKAPAEKTFGCVVLR